MKKIITLFVATFISIEVFAQWDTLTTNTTTDFNSICFGSESNGVAVGNDPVSTFGNVYYTADGGINWSLVESTSYGINDVYFLNQAVGYIAADSGYIMQSSFNGQIWSLGAQIGDKDFYSIYFPNDTVGYVGGEDGVLYRTSDFGATWDTLNSGTNLAINDIYFQDEFNGWIVGDGGYMAATANGGQTWTLVTQPYFGFFNCTGFAYVGATPDAFAVGNTGDMIHSADGGFSWSAYSSNTTYNLNSVRFVNDLAGIICGDNGIIRRTMDGGQTWWDETMSYVTEELIGISWASDTLAYICGSNGRILKSHIDISSVHTILGNGFEISAFPNPFADALNIVIDLDKNSSVQIVVLDLTGRILLQENEGELNPGKQIIHPQGISSLVSGMYFVKVISEGNEMVIPVVKR